MDLRMACSIILIDDRTAIRRQFTHELQRLGHISHTYIFGVGISRRVTELKPDVLVFGLASDIPCCDVRARITRRLKIRVPTFVLIPPGPECSTTTNGWDITHISTEAALPAINRLLKDLP